LFFLGVKSTGIFCRPVCPAKTPKEENVDYFPTAAAAIEAGFRPCLRCRPESAPGNGLGGDSSVAERALAIIREGGLNDGTIEDLAEKVGTGSRHLRRLFIRHLGAPPVQIANVQRTLFAKKLLAETHLSVTQIAMASGFGSLRQFNDVFKEICGLTPSDIRKQTRERDPLSGAACDLTLSYRPDFDWSYMLGFMKSRIIPGVETIDENLYRRAFRIPGGSEGWLEVTNQPERHALKLSVHTTRLDDLMLIQQRVRVMFDLEANLEPVREHLKRDPLLFDVVNEFPSVRLPGAWDPFEFAIRAILGQQISVKAATTLASRIAATCGKACGDSFPEDLTHFFPTAEEMAGADISSLGITGKRQETIRHLLEAVLSGAISLERGQALDSFVENFTSLKGIGPWTAHYLGMRALGLTDAFPASDLGVRKALAVNGNLPSESEVNRRAEQWRPWRAYAALYLWKLAAIKEKQEKQQ
jgi:AraC family transcriptional regulator of adaptative response / DNA-3-methyladenine glycosylase II